MASLGVRLDPVPETLLWTLWHRAVEARRTDSVLDDPLAVELVERIDFPFAERFGDGEGLETQLWRVDDGRVRWVSVDFPDVVELRRKLLPVHPRTQAVACWSSSG